MKKQLILVVVLSLFFASIGCSYGYAGLLIDFPNPTEDAKIRSYVRVGFERAGANLTLPIELVFPSQVGPLPIHALDISLRDANLWCGTAGLNVPVSKDITLFASATGLLPRPIIIYGQAPVVFGGLGTTANLEFTGSKVEAWYGFAGAGLGPILLGLYLDHSTISLSDPRQGSQPLLDQTLRADILTKTLAPFLGVAIREGGAVAAATYSALAWSNTAVSVRDSFAAVSELYYKWNRPGDFVSASFQYETHIARTLSFGVYGIYMWTRMRGDAELQVQTPIAVLQKDVTASLTKYTLQGGVTLSLEF